MPYWCERHVLRAVIVSHVLYDILGPFYIIICCYTYVFALIYVEIVDFTSKSTYWGKAPIGGSTWPIGTSLQKGRCWFWERSVECPDRSVVFIDRSVGAFYRSVYACQGRDLSRLEVKWGPCVYYSGRGLTPGNQAKSWMVWCCIDACCTVCMISLLPSYVIRTEPLCACLCILV